MLPRDRQSLETSGLAYYHQSGSKANGWLNPSIRKCNTVDLIVEVVQRYPVDGIQLDDHFAALSLATTTYQALSK